MGKLDILFLSYLFVCLFIKTRSLDVYVALAVLEFPM